MVSVPTRVNCRPKLTRVTSSGSRGVRHDNFRQVLDAGASGEAAQKNHAPVSVRAKATMRVAAVDVYQALNV